MALFLATCCRQFQIAEENFSDAAHKCGHAVGGFCCAVRGPAVRTWRSLRGRAGAGNPQSLFRADHRSAHRLLRGAGAAIRPRPRAHGKSDRGLAGQSERCHRGGSPSGGRAAPAGIVPPAQSGAGRHRGAGADARTIARRHGASRRSCGGRRRFRPSVLVLVQSRLSGAARHRLVDAGEHPRKDHQARGGAQDPELGRSAPPDRSRRPLLLRVLPSGAER